MKRLLISAVWQPVWHWPAVVNLIMGGTAGGIFLNMLFSGKAIHPGSGFAWNPALKLTAALLVCSGFAAVAAEAGRPLAARHLLKHWRTSWMTRELAVGFLFVFQAALSSVVASGRLETSTALTAAAFVLCQGFMVLCAHAVTAWNRPIIPLHFLTSSICLGFGFVLAWAAAADWLPSHQTVAIGLGSLAINAAVWHACITKTSQENLRRATMRLRNPKALVLTFGIGHLLPALLLIASMLFATFAPGTSHGFRAVYFLSGCAIVLGGIYQKSGLILAANMLREIRADFLNPGAATAIANSGSAPHEEYDDAIKPDQAQCF